MKKVEEQIAENSVTATKPKKSNKVLLNKELLPSRGTFYPNDIYVRKLNAKEIKDLSTVKPSNVDVVFNSIISDCLEGMELKNILLNDKLWLIYYLRSITYNDMPFAVKVKCPHCGRETKEQFVLNRLNVKYADTPLPKQIELPNGDVIEPCWPTIGVELQINRLKNDPNVIEEIDSDIMTICAHIKTINGKTATLFDAYSYFTGDDCRGSAMDFNAFCQGLKPATFGARPLFTTDCPCGEEVYSEITLSPDFFLPSF